MTTTNEDTMPEGMTEAERHHFAHGAYSYDPKTETRVEGRARCARQAARDEAELLRYIDAGHVKVVILDDEWPTDGDADPEVLADMIEGLESGRYAYVETRIEDEDGRVLAALGGTCTDAGETVYMGPLPGGYLRTVAVELWDDALDELREINAWRPRDGEPSVEPCTCATKTDDDGRPLKPEWSTCGTCGFVWCDRCNPTPSARTPCEYEHVFNEDDEAGDEIEGAERFRPSFDEDVAGCFAELLAYVANDLGAPSFAADLACKGGNARALEVMAGRWTDADLEPAEFADVLRDLVGAYDSDRARESLSSEAFDSMMSRGLECYTDDDGACYVAGAADHVLGPFTNWHEASRNPMIRGN